MTPVRVPDVVRGDVPGLLCNWMPVRHDGHLRGENPGVVRILADGGVWYTSAIERMVVGRSCCLAETCHVGSLAELRIDWSDRAAIYLSLAWLADRGHVCTWMLPTTHGGHVEAWADLTAWEVSAILVARSVGRVARGVGPVRTIVRAFRPVNLRMSMDNVGGAAVFHNATDADRDHFIAPPRLGPDVRATPDHVGWMYTPRVGLSTYGMETGADAVAKINACALADGCVLQVPGGLLLPDLGAEHE